MTDPLADREAAARALACLDLTDLNDDCDEAAINALAARAVTSWGSVAALCIWPRFIEQAKAALAPDVRVATVICFPSGEATDEEAIAQTEEALRLGADEIDMVIPYIDLMEGRGSVVRSRVERVKRAAGEATVKAILETGVLAGPDLIRKASELAVEGGADFLKTSTGKVPVNATLSGAETMLTVISKADHPVGFKAAGGIRTTADAMAYLEVADRIMGEGWATPATFRFGASGLLDALTATLRGEAPAETGAGY